MGLWVMQWPHVFHAVLTSFIVLHVGDWAHFECCVFRSDLLLMPSGSLTFQNEKKADAFCPCIFMFGVLGHGAYAGCEIASHTFFSSR